MRPIIIAALLVFLNTLPAHAAASATAQLKVKGMACEACRLKVDKALEAVPGVEKAEVDLQAGTATVHYDPEKTDLDALARAVDKLGFRVVR